MTSSWTNPTIVTQYAEEGGENVHVLWDDTDNFANLKHTDGYGVGTMGYLEHIARSPKTDTTNKTYYIRATGYNFVNLPETISGIEIRLTANRRGRITDDTVQLCLNNNLIGENRATLAVNPLKVYGGETDIWAVDNLSIEDIRDNSFGVVLRFKSHPSWPHRDAVFVDSVEIRIH